MNKEFWLGRWERGETGWHQGEVEPALAKHFAKLAPTRVLVPLCGKSLDMIWLASQGHQVIGVELSDLACRTFFDENKLHYQTSTEGPFQVFHSERVTIFNGDFFELTPKHIGRIGAVYDRAALIALPPEDRKRYSQAMIRLLRKAAEPELTFLQIVLERTPPDEQGPPFSVSQKELETLYRGSFRIKPLSREKIDMAGGPASTTEECVYSLQG